MFELKAESHTNVTVLRFSGNLLLPDVAEFSKLLEEHLLAPNIRQVVLDLSHVEKVDTSGLGVLVSASTCLLYTSPSPRDTERSRMPSSA